MSAVVRGGLVIMGGACLAFGAAIPVALTWGPGYGFSAGLLVSGAWALHTARQR